MRSAIEGLAARRRKSRSKRGAHTIFGATHEEMTVEHLKILARNANIEVRSKMTKRSQLVEAIKKYLQEHPLQGAIDDEGNVEAVASDEVAVEATHIAGAVVVQTTAAVSSSDVTSECAVNECKWRGSPRKCRQCQLLFCEGLHVFHASHRCQQLKSAYKVADEWNNVPAPLVDPSITAALSIPDPTLIQAAIRTQAQAVSTSIIDSEDNNSRRSARVLILTSPRSPRYLCYTSYYQC